MKEHIIRPHIFHKWVRMIILLILTGSFILGLYELQAVLDRGFESRFELMDWRFIFSFILTAFMVLVYYDQEQKAQYYIKWDDRNIYIKLSSDPEEIIDINAIDKIKANYSKVFIYMKDGSKKLVNFYSLNPRFKDVQSIISINDIINFRRRFV
ncbi:hypothetical protein [Membranihabitans marinus]|uniref:hypothetical protein n=1 Tax=Membranihabitans marinus TaxID=1227546 RepID=UPI001F46BEEB|nr:hypothetical protein [Membranihabitans marinus]